ncbi:putative nuclease HARBI1 [Dermacentor silvarum]|uniref:putative nuclease HARBI1 n=1 Tax=Dermacentor silvarum TaxID=543639 RepID=UPI001897E132|nr:putative nuclease HARBI1 [Dermacentor silvarum]
MAPPCQRQDPTAPPFLRQPPPPPPTPSHLPVGRIEDARRGRPERATSPEEDLLIVAASAADPFLNGKEIRDELALTSICDADMRILTVYPVRPGSDHDSFVWRTTWLRRWFQAGRIANPGVYLIGDSGYPLDPWLLTPVPGHPPMQTAEGKYNTAHATLRSVVERCIGLLMSRFRCLQRYGTFLYEPERAANIVAACAVLHTQPSAV